MNEYLGEFLGTAVLVLLGDGVVAGVLLSRSKAQNAGWLAITTGWALAVMAGVFTARAVGAPGYINPVGPLAVALTDGLDPIKALGLMGAEFAGAFVGAMMVWLHYLPHWSVTDDPATKLGVFCTAPAIRQPVANVMSEAIGTFVLVLVGAAIIEKELLRGLMPALGGAVVWAIGLSLGGTTGYAINPARDFGPRLAHAVLPISGKGGSDWGYAWVPVIGPFVGGALAALLAKAVMWGPVVAVRP